jgi:hypothetical protein
MILNPAQAKKLYSLVRKSPVWTGFLSALVFLCVLCVKAFDVSFSAGKNLNTEDTEKNENTEKE